MRGVRRWGGHGSEQRPRRRGPARLGPGQIAHRTPPGGPQRERLGRRGAFAALTERAARGLVVDVGVILTSAPIAPGSSNALSIGVVTSVLVSLLHLTRHCCLTYDTADTKEKPFVCTCGAAFARRDLLTRHQRISLHTGEAENPRPSPTPDVVTAITDSSLELDNASSWAEQQQLPAGPQAYLDPDAQQDLMVTQETFDQCRQPIPQTGLEHSYLLRTGQTLDYNFDQFWEFAGFLDGIGLPAEWSPYFHGPDAHDTTSGEAPKGNPPARGARLGTPFNSWLPSVPAGDRAPDTHFDQGRFQPQAPSVSRADANLQFAGYRFPSS